MAERDWEPVDLGSRGGALWDQITGRYDLRPDELATLADACREADIIEELQAQFETRDLITTGSMGQDVAAPHVSEIRQHRVVLTNLLKQLKLPDEDGGRAGQTTSDKARMAANARWHPRGA